MKVAIMQPYLFPYLGYWQLLRAVNVFVIFDDVNYIKRGWINRNNILLNKAIHRITLPVAKASCFKKINEHAFASDSNSLQKLLDTLKIAYSKRPLFSHAFPLVERILKYDDLNLPTFFEHQFALICGYLNVEVEFVHSSKLRIDNELKGQDRIIGICKTLGATKYINPIGGTELYQKNRFMNEGIELMFLKHIPIPYAQGASEFVPNLSIIDTLMNVSPENFQGYLSGYQLV